MNENVINEVVEIQDQDLFTGDPAELESETELTVEDIVAEIVGSAESLSGYQIITLTNAVIKAAGGTKVLPTQMGYIYGSKGMIAKRTKGMAGKDIRYTNEEAIAWITKKASKDI
jgi:hypothetical protein